jgi:hypothetical protein
LSNSITSSYTAKLLIELAAIIRVKIQEFSPKETVEESKEELFVNSVCDVIVNELTAMYGEAEPLISVKYDSAYGVLKMLKSIFKKNKPACTIKTVKLILNLAHSLNARPSTYLTESEKTFTFITSLVGYTDDRFLSLLKDYPSKARYSFLQFLFAKTENKAILEEIAQKFHELVLNEKEHFNTENLIFFAPFLMKASDSTFKEFIAP